MASKKKTSRVISGAASEKSVNSAVASLVEMAGLTAKAITVVDKERKSLATVAKRLSKKRATLSRKKKAASLKAKKEANAENKKVLKAIEKEIASIRKEATKIAAKKSAVSAELMCLKTVAKRALAYTRTLEKADKILNKPKKKKRKKKKVVVAIA